MEQSKPIRIESTLLDDAESERPKYFGTTTTWIAYLIRVGLNYHLGLDPCGRLGKPNDKERKKEKREVLPITNSSNNINKEKNKKWKFEKSQIPKELDFCKDSVIKFWSVKSGAKSQEACKLLIGDKGLLGISQTYGQTIAQEQLETAIANEWQSITLKNYEAFGRPKTDGKEPATNHPAGKVFTASDIYGEV
jgi:hypothetical protein